MLIGRAVMAHTRGDLEQAQTAAAHALAIAIQDGDTTIVVHAQHLLGHIEQASGNVAKASVLLAQSLEGFKTMILGSPFHKSPRHQRLKLTACAIPQPTPSTQRFIPGKLEEMS